VSTSSPDMDIAVPTTLPGSCPDLEHQFVRLVTTSPGSGGWPLTTPSQPSFPDGLCNVMPLTRRRRRTAERGRVSSIHCGAWARSTERAGPPTPAGAPAFVSPSTLTEAIPRRRYRGSGWPSPQQPLGYPQVLVFRPTSSQAYGRGMASFEVKLKDGTVEIIKGADAYQPDGQFTTFFSLEEGRSAVDCWSVRMASIRSAEIVAVWRRADADEDQRMRRPSAAA